MLTHNSKQTTSLFGVKRKREERRDSEGANISSRPKERKKERGGLDTKGEREKKVSWKDISNGVCC